MLPPVADRREVTVFVLPVTEPATTMLVRAIDGATLVSAFTTRRIRSTTSEAYIWSAKHRRHEQPVHIVLDLVRMPDEPVMRMLSIGVGEYPASVLVTDPHHVVASGIVTTVLRGYGLQGII